MICSRRSSGPHRSPAGLPRRMLTVLALGVAAAAVGASPSAAQGGAAPSGKPTRASQMIEIRGQVPTPQVVTVRPREVPPFSRDVLTPAYFDLHFWDALLTPYEIAPNLSVDAGVAPIALAPPPLPTDSGHRPPPAVDSARILPSAGPAGSPAGLPGAAAPTTPAGAGASPRPDTTSPTAPREK